MTSGLEFTILGSGSSGGVPRADGDWGRCDPTEPKNLRTRCSLLVRRKALQDHADNTTILIDTSPDLRLQTAVSGATRLDAVLYTHDHADQAHGIDDLRAFAIRQHRRIPCYMDEATAKSLVKRRFAYIFEGEGGYQPICEHRPLPSHGEAWAVEGPSGAVPIVSFEVDHGGMNAVGYRFGDVAYCPDVVRLPQQAMRALQNLDIMIIDALRDAPHPTHAHVALALDWIAELKPRRAILTNLHIDLDYDALSRRLPPGVEPAYDGLRFESSVGGDHVRI